MGSLKILFLARLVKRLVRTRQFTDGESAGYLPCHENSISKKLKAGRRRRNLKHPWAMHSFRYGRVTRDTIHGALVPEGVMRRSLWCSKKRMSKYVKPVEYMPNVQPLTTEQRQPVDCIRENLYEYFNALLPEQRDRTYWNLATMQRVGAEP